MSHRSTILLVTCVTCFGLAPLLEPSPARGSTGEQEATSLSVKSHTFFSNRSQEHSLEPSIDIAQATPKPDTPTTDDTAEEASVLKLGSRGAGVSEVQTLLKDLGYYNGPVDGVFGDATKFAAIEFQKDQVGLPVDGQVGPTTLESLREAAKAAPTPTPSASPEAGTASPDPAESPASEGEPAADAAPARSSRPGWLWWIVTLLAIGAAAGFALDRWKRPGIKRRKSKALSSDAASSRRVSVDGAPLSTHGLAVEGGAIAHTNGFASANGVDAGSESIQPEITPISETTRIRKATLVEELVRDLHSSDPGKRRKAIWDLGQVGDSNAIDPLVDLMMDSDSSQRSLILAAISEIGIRTLKPLNRALLISLQDRSPEVRKNAIRDITRVYDLIGQMSEMLAHAAADADDEVRETAHWALGQLNRIRNVPELGNGASLPANQTKAPEQLSGDSSVNQ